MNLVTMLSERLRGAGLTDLPAEYDSAIHGWRCSHPDMYGPCSCFAELVADLRGAVLAVLGSDEMRVTVARAILAGDIARGYAADEWGDGADEPWLIGNATDALAAVVGALRGQS